MQLQQYYKAPSLAIYILASRSNIARIFIKYASRLVCMHMKKIGPAKQITSKRKQKNEQGGFVATDQKAGGREITMNFIKIREN